jgi:hypothetical protein
MWWRHGCPLLHALHLTYFLHMVVALESIHVVVYLLDVQPSSWATEDDHSSTILPFLFFFVGTKNPSSNQFLSPFNK